MIKHSTRPTPPQAQDSGKISKFWEDFRKEAANQRVKESAQRWYVIQVEQYIKAAEGKRLREHGPREVTAYLESLGRKGCGKK